MFDEIIEKCIAAATVRGDFDDLPGAGVRLELADASLVPEDLRLACRVPRNAGYTPVEFGLRKQIADLQAELASGERGGDEANDWKKLALLRAHLSSSHGASERSFAIEF